LIVRSRQTLGLQIELRGFKPPSMKTLPRTVRFVVLAAVAVFATFTFHALATKPVQDLLGGNRTYTLRLNNACLKNLPNGDTDANVKSFKDALDAMQKNHGAIYALNIKRSGNSGGEEDIAAPTPFAKLNIKTDKVTTSDAMKGSPNEELTLIAPHITQQVASNSLSDIQTVLSSFQ
jgi:plasmid replication initiation protein